MWIALALLCVATAVKAREPVEIVTADITGAPDTAAVRHGLELGAQFSIPLSGADVASSELGMNAGLSLTSMSGPTLGIGLDLAYHYWPASNGFKQGFNSLLSRETFDLARLGGTTWKLSALQMTGHLKVVAPAVGRVRPWLKAGAGAYLVDPHTSGFSAQEFSFQVKIGPFPNEIVAGFSGIIGVDLLNRGRTSFGLDASYDHLWSHDALGSNFDALALGVHVLFAM